MFWDVLQYAHIHKSEHGNLTRKQERAHCLDMAVTPRGIGYMIQFRGRHCIVVMFVSMKKNSARTEKLLQKMQMLIQKSVV